MANSVDPDQTAPIGAVCSGPTRFASILNLSVMLGIYLQQTTSKARINVSCTRTQLSDAGDSSCKQFRSKFFRLFWRFKG